ncbi:MAG TPA: hypothetical protein VM241_00445 [Candidatus Thermoplasmatota archaeon]|nr:hypothetical protein [Candidatus Thermoplasmatota archaeon]
MGFPSGSAASAVLLGLFLLLPAADAGAATVVDTVRLDLHGGSAGASLAGAVFQGQACAGLSLFGTVEHVHLEVDRSAGPTLNGQVPLSKERTVTREDFDADGVTLTLSQTGASCIVAAWLDPGMAATVAFPGDVGLTPAPVVPATIQSHGNASRAPAQVGGRDLVRATGPAGVAQLAGSLRLSVWEATLDLRAGNRSFHGFLGYSERGSATAPGQPAPLLVDTEQAEAYLWLTGARLAWTLPPQSEVLASTATVDAPAGSADLHDAFLDGAPAPAPVVTVTAPRGTLRASGQHILGSLEVGSTSAVPGSAVAHPGARLSSWPVWAFGLLLVSIAGGRRLALAGLRSALDADACERAAGLALAVWPPSAESRVARVVCLLRLGRLDAAARALGSHGWRSQRATRSFLQARLEASRGNAAAARRHLADCFLLAPAFVADARADRALHGIVEAALGHRGHHREGYA